MPDSLSDSPKPVVTPDDDDYADIAAMKCEWRLGPRRKRCGKQATVHHVAMDLYLCAECANQEEM